MRIIFANRYFFPDQSATSRMVSSLAFALAAEGIEVTALASRHFHDRQEVRLPARETIEGVDVRRIWTSSFGRSGVAGRAADYATFHLSAAAWWLSHTRRGDICVVCTDPPLLSVTAAGPVRLRGGRMVNWVMDLFPETAMELGMLPREGLLGALTLRLRDRSLDRADLTISPIAAMTRYLSERSSDPQRFVTVHHWSNGEEIRPVPPAENPLRREWGLEGAFVVGYSGNFGRAHEFATLIGAAERLQDHPDIRFLLIGQGKQHTAVRKEAARRGLRNVIFKPFQPSEVLAQSLSAADLHIVSLLPALEYCIVPSKFYGVLAAGRPAIFIGDENGEVATLLRKGACGETVSPGDAEGLAAAILRLKSSPVLCQTMGERARRLLESDFTLPHGVARWRNAVAPLLPQNHQSRAASLPLGAGT
jgi:Glycosyltransferase